MATIRYRQRGVKNFGTMKLEMNQEKVQLIKVVLKQKNGTIDWQSNLSGNSKGTTLNSEMSLPQLYKQWYELKIEKSGRSKATLQKYLQYEQKIVEYLDFPLNVITPMLYQKQLNIIGKNVNRGFLSLMTNAIKSDTNGKGR